MSLPEPPYEHVEKMSPSHRNRPFDELPPAVQQRVLANLTKDVDQEPVLLSVNRASQQRRPRSSVDDDAMDTTGRPAGVRPRHRPTGGRN